MGGLGFVGLKLIVSGDRMQVGMGLGGKLYRLCSLQQYWR